MVAGGATAAILGKRILDSIPRSKCPTCISSPNGKGLNFLIMGSDSRAGLTDAQKLALHVGHAAGQRSDTMILMHIPENGGKAEMVSLPRDSYVTIPAHCPGGNPPSKQNTCPKGASVIPAAPNKLNAAYSFGGPTLAVATVEANTNVPIDHYVVINFSGFVNMVDKLGGVPICSPTPIHDPVVRDAEGNYSGSGLELNAGTTTLHGAQALEYVRAREFDPSQGDLGRIQRQQKFMGALLNKAESAGVILDLPKLYNFLKAVTASLKVDSGLTNGTILGLAKRLHSLSPKNVDLLTVPLSDTNYASSVGSAVLWDPTLSKELFHDFKADKSVKNVIGSQHQKITVAPADIALKVLNATSTAGKAAVVAQALVGVGFPSPSTGNAPNGTDPSRTVVLYGPSRSDSAQTVHAAVPGSAIQEDKSLGSSIELVVGSNYSTVRSVKVSTASSDRPTVRTGATNPCS
jgi:LCP family protein required for cell wall assembly